MTTTSVTLELAVLPLPLAAGVELPVGDDELVGVVVPLVLLLPGTDIGFDDRLAARAAGKFNLIPEPEPVDDNAAACGGDATFSFEELGLRPLDPLVDPIRGPVETDENGSDIVADTTAGV